MQQPDFAVAPKKPALVKPGPEQNPWFWSPSLVGVRFAPPSFFASLRDIGEELTCTWSPVHERWLIWARSPRVNNKYSRGWNLLFINQETDGSYLPLDERVFARLYAASAMTHGNARKYFDHVVRQMEREKEQAEKDQFQETMDRSMDVWNHAQIKNIGKGNKFTTYLS